MIEACSSCGYTVDPNCDVCKGVGEYNACATVPPAEASDAETKSNNGTSFPDIGALQEQALAWNTVCAALDEVSPGWRSLTSRGMDSAVKAIRASAPTSRVDPVIDEDTATVMEALDFGQFSADMLCGVLAGGAARGIAKSTQQALSRYLQRQYSLLYANHPTSRAQATAAPAEGNEAIDLIGCAIVAFKANVPLFRPPQVLLGLRKKEEGFNLWVLPGGKQSFDESPEECLRRETKEEIGVTRLISLKPVSFAYNNDDPNRKYLMLYYTAYIAGHEPYIAAAHEFSDLRWFDVDMLPPEMWQTDRDAIANTLLMRPK